MTFKLVYYSQQDPKWKSDILGFGDPGDTIGYVGCALTSVAMLLSGHGFAETPQTLNQKLKNVGGFASAGIVWGAVTKLYPQVTLKAFIPCANSDAPLAQIDAALAAGQPAIVMVDSSPAAGLQTHWVLLYARKGDDYLMLDPWPYQPDVTKETYLMPRYSRGNPLQRSIMHIILFDNSAADGTIATPSETTGTPQTPPAPGPVPSPAGPQARVKADVTAGLNVRSSIDTSSLANLVESVPAGALLTLLEADGASKIGAVNQWVRVRTSSNKEGFAAAWYLEAVTASIPTPPPPTPAPQPVPAPATPPPATTPPPPDPTARLKVSAKTSLKVYDRASTSGKVVSTQAAGSILACLEDPSVASPKVGVKGQWLNIRYATAKKGFVQAELVQLAS
jgi:hypothetical protein